MPRDKRVISMMGTYDLRSWAERLCRSSAIHGRRTTPAQTQPYFWKGSSRGDIEVNKRKSGKDRNTTVLEGSRSQPMPGRRACLLSAEAEAEACPPAPVSPPRHTYDVLLLSV